MKILFLAGGLEPGHNGVGDYTRRLAEQLNHRGHDCFLVGLEDRSLEPLAEQRESGECRLGAAVPWRRRFAILEDVIKTWTPDWVSVQFVPYAYEKRGLPFTFGQGLISLARKYALRWQVMFHELWTGVTPEEPWRHHVVGFFQRRLLQRLVRELRPVVHTQCRWWQERLAADGIASQLLPLFGNIPRAEPVALREVVDVSVPNPFVALSFGHVTDRLDRLRWKLEEVVRVSRQANREPVFLLCGRSGTRGPAALALARELLDPGNVIDVGPVAAETVSRLLQVADIGLARVPLRLVDKSGTAMAMLEHGLPVLAWNDVGTMEAARAYLGLEGVLVSLDHLPERIPPQEFLTTTTDRFEQSLANPRPEAAR